MRENSDFQPPSLREEPLDRRGEQRVSIELQVEYSSFDDFVRAYTLDVSGNGLFVETEDLLDVGSVAKLTISLPEGGPNVHVAARVVHVVTAEAAGASGNRVGMGMQFLEQEGNDSLEKIQKYLVRKSIALPTPSGSPPVRGKVLVVDDSDQHRSFAVSAMQKAGFDVRFAKDGLEGLGLALREAPDIILTDVNMPKMDGWHLLRLVRARPNLAHIPVIFLTTLSSDSDRLRGYRLGVDDYLGKPYKPEELTARVERILMRSRNEAKAVKKALRGDLEQVALTSLLSLAEMERRTGALTLRNGSEKASLLLREGAVVRIELPAPHGNKPAMDRFFHVLDWQRGHFELSADDVTVEDDIQMPTSFVLLEHARRRDETA